MRKVLTFAAVAEAATGVALIVVPSLVVRLLFGADIAGASVVMSRITDGMGLGAGEVELDGRRGRSFRLSSDGTGKRQNQQAEAQYRQGLERCSGASNSPIEG